MQAKARQRRANLRWVIRSRKAAGMWAGESSSDSVSSRRLTRTKQSRPHYPLSARLIAQHPLNHNPRRPPPSSSLLQYSPPLQRQP